MQRPFRSRLATYDDDDDVETDRAAEAEHGQRARILTAATAPGDVRGDLIFAGDEPVARRRMAGRACDVHTTGASLLRDTVVGPASGAMRVEVCIDAAHGFVLEEVTFEGANIIRRWVATEVDTSRTVTIDDRGQRRGRAGGARREASGPRGAGDHPARRYLVVSGSLPTDQIVDLTRSLRAVEGTELVYVEDEAR